MNSIIIPQLSKLTAVLKGQDDFMYFKMTPISLVNICHLTVLQFFILMSSWMTNSPPFFFSSFEM